MTLGLDAMEEAYVNAIDLLLEIKMTSAIGSQYISDGYADMLVEHREKLRPKVTS